MIRASDRIKAVQLIDEAVKNGASAEKACAELTISQRTYARWKARMEETGSCEDLRPTAERPAPPGKLTEEEEQEVLHVLSMPEYADLPPCEIVPALADQGLFLCSESTMYRIMKKHRLSKHRGPKKEKARKAISTYAARFPNQVWVWDITYLPGPIKGSFYYLYVITDLYSRFIVGWEVWAEQSAEHAAQLIQRASLLQKRVSIQKLILHSDNGSPMKGATMLEKLKELGIKPSNSRPRTSNDNAFVESLFSTLKSRAGFKANGYASLQEARVECGKFVHWYNYEHRHSGLKYTTPAERHEGRSPEILAKREEVYAEAKARHPERWQGRKTRNWELSSVVYLNPEKVAKPDDAKETNPHF